MRTTADLIEELSSEAKKFVLLSLVVGFEDECKMINSKEPERLKKLNALVKAGGEPIGFVGLINNGKNQRTAKAKVMVTPLREHDSDAHIKRVLERVADAFRKQMKAAGALISPKNASDRD